MNKNNEVHGWVRACKWLLIGQKCLHELLCCPFIRQGHSPKSWPQLLATVADSSVSYMIAIMCDHRYTISTYPVSKWSMLSLLSHLSVVALGSLTSLWSRGTGISLTWSHKNIISINYSKSKTSQISKVLGHPLFYLLYLTYYMIIRPTASIMNCKFA